MSLVLFALILSNPEQNEPLFRKVRATSPGTLDEPIHTAKQNGPGYTLNCLDLMLKNQGADLSDLTILRNERTDRYPFK